MCRRWTLLASLAAALLGGCAAGRGDRYSPQMAANAPDDRPPLPIAEAVDRHNRNVAKVERLQAASAVTTSSRLLAAGGSGLLSYEKPRNFRFRVEAGMKARADFGSNEDEFWFWGDERKSPATIYKCHYDSLAESAEQPPFQPDWIVESMGLHEIPAAEMQKIRIVKGVKPGVDQWTHTRAFGRSTTTKVTLVDQATGRFLEHRFYAPTMPTPIAIATPSDFRELKAADGTTAILPQAIQLKVLADPKQTMDLKLVLSGPKLNEPMTQEERTALFEPEAADIHKGAQVYYLDDSAVARGRGDRPAGVQRRQSLPQPPAGPNGRAGAPAELGAPTPFDQADGASLRRKDPMPRDEGELSAAREGAASVVGVHIPQPPE